MTSQSNFLPIIYYFVKKQNQNIHGLTRMLRYSTVMNGEGHFERNPLSGIFSDDPPERAGGHEYEIT